MSDLFERAERLAQQAVDRMLHSDGEFQAYVDVHSTPIDNGKYVALYGYWFRVGGEWEPRKESWVGADSPEGALRKLIGRLERAA